MRALILLIIGLLVGAFCGMTAARQIAAAHAYPRGVMAIVQHHLAAAKLQTQGAGQCDAIKALQHLTSMQSLVPEIPIALSAPAVVVDPHIAELNQALSKAVAAAVSIPRPADCAMLSAPIHAIEQACADCHREYR